MLHFRRLVIGICTLALCASAVAQNHGIGLYNSPRGFGISYEMEGRNPAYFTTFTLYADIYGVTANRTPHPGVKFNTSRLYYVDIIQGHEVSFIFYVGPGLSAGYVHDFEKIYWEDLYSSLTKKAGAVLALSGTGGCRFAFNRAIMLDLSFTIEAGMHIRNDDGETKLSLYKNGVIETFFPQLGIFFLF